ncbi:hypothetical protein F1D05_12635 [Kribbella qitaiheensis]|uniref:Uncharacterized protein n=1 Tax=Kribbella qitaiheensis TaxID=1544730 RepID=A0A7G6WX84_9ACTN|nr:hypothetical protein [Kribbella qitaiheensis]QNE18599.1 hypothetical protein F1D05_12635 [Kribbella qitaiheensis]
MEITDRSDLGSDLFAPTTQQAGLPYWGYELITHVQAGDIVLHWHKSLIGEPAIVGWSIATGVYEDTNISWQARGTVGRIRGTLDARPAWRMPLENYTPFIEPITVEDVRAHDMALRDVQADLESRYLGTLYFAFGFSDKRSLRAQQTYFVKMPREVLDELVSWRSWISSRHQARRRAELEERPNVQVPATWQMPLFAAPLNGVPSSWRLTGMRRALSARSGCGLPCLSPPRSRGADHRRRQHPTSSWGLPDRQ